MGAAKAETAKAGGTVKPNQDRIIYIMENRTTNHNPLLWFSFPVQRQEKPDRRADALAAFNADRALRLRHAARDLAQAQTGAGADILGREERFGCARHDLRRHAGGRHP